MAELFMKAELQWINVQYDIELDSKILEPQESETQDGLVWAIFFVNCLVMTCFYVCLLCID